MKSNRPCVAGLGELVWDLLPSDRLPGGAPANFAFHVAQLGGEGIIASAVGNDPDGHQLLDWLNDVNLDTGHIQINEQPTGTVSVALSAQGQPDYVIHENAAWDHLHWNPSLALLAGRVDCVCVGSLAQRSGVSRKTILQFLRATRPRCLRIFDVNLRPPHYDLPAILETLSLSSVLKVNEQEWSVIAGAMQVDVAWESGMAQLMEKTDLQYISLTRGAAGNVLLSRSGMSILEGQAVNVVDTIGAGDAFTAALAMGISRGEPIDQVQRQAAAVANYVCTQQGATPILPDGLLAEIRSPRSKVFSRGAAII